MLIARRPLLTALAFALLAVPGARGATPAPSCPGVHVTSSTFATIGVGPAFWAENMGFDGRGGMWVSELQLDKLVRFDSSGTPGAALDVDAPGASLLGPDGFMYLLFGDAVGGPAGVLRFDPTAAAPKLQPFTAGLKMANGAGFGPDGSLYVADTTGTGLIRIGRDGRVDPTFAAATPVAGADGIAIAGDQLFTTLFTDRESSIVRVPLSDPKAFTTLTRLSPASDPAAVSLFLDDAAFGPDGQLYVASNTGSILRVSPSTGDACTAVSGLGVPVDSIRFPRAFAPYDQHSDAFATSETGVILRLHFDAPLADAPKPPATALPALRVTATPRHLVVHRRATLHVRVTSSAAACRSGVRVRAGSHSARTGADGHATLRVRYGSPGLRQVRAAKAGCRAASTTVRVRR